MKLYALRRIADGKFFVHTDGLGDLVMNSTPVFWKTPEGVYVNLKRVCARYSPYNDRWGFVQKDWTDFDARTLACWEVLIVNAKILGESFIPASEFVDKNALRDLDVRTRPNLTKVTTP